MSQVGKDLPPKQPTQKTPPTLKLHHKTNLMTTNYGKSTTTHQNVIPSSPPPKRNQKEEQYSFQHYYKIQA
jgi:hypothetical protein